MNTDTIKELPALLNQKRNAAKFKRLFPADDVRLSIAESEY
jgi:hypothetical protein